MNRGMDRRLANLERIAPQTRNSLPLHEWIARTEQDGWADVISVRFSNGQRVKYARGRDGFLEKLAELKRVGLINDETGVEFTITHTFVDPPKRGE
jgi:hypothetical protein